MDHERIRRLNADLLARTGVDLGRYRDPTLVEAIGDAVTFPRYLARSLSRPVGLLLLLAVLAFVLTDSAYLRTFLVFPGILVIIVNGVLLGLVLFVGRIRDDMTTVFTIASDLSVQALKDIGAAQSRLRTAPVRFPGLLEIVQGVNAIVVLPIVIETLQRKIPFLGKPAAALTERFFRLADARLAAAISRRAPAALPAAEPGPAAIAGWLESAERAVEAAQSSVSRVARAVARIVAFPFVAVFSIVLLISVALAWGGYLLLG